MARIRDNKDTYADVDTAIEPPAWLGISIWAIFILLICALGFLRPNFNHNHSPTSSIESRN